MKIKVIILSVATILLAGAGVFFFCLDKEKDAVIRIDLNALYDLTNDKALTVYELSQLNELKNDFENNKLDKVYVTKFVFDGVSSYKEYDLDEFISKGYSPNIKTVDVTAININNVKDVYLTGELEGGALLINTNGITKDINVYLDNAKINTNSKKVPAIYVYNKDTNYTDHKVTIRTVKGTNNYVVGGKFKKISLIAREELSDYANYYQGEAKELFESYPRYYDIYKKEEVEKILFAKVKASADDLKDGDPYYFYKGAGAISSDIDLYFEGEGYLEVSSLNDEGIETKGNLTFAGKSGDYTITAFDDALNTTSEETGARNTLTIDVKSLKALVSVEAKEGDAIDSNGEIIINGGTVLALSKPGQDSGIDATKGIYINGGTVLATGDMYDEIKDSSKQKFMVLSFENKMYEYDQIALLDSSDNLVFGFSSDRDFSTLVYSSSKLTDGTYSLFRDGAIEGQGVNGFYDSGTYTKGTKMGYLDNNVGMNPMGGNPGTNMMPGGNQTPPDKPDGNGAPVGVGFISEQNSEFVINKVSNLFGKISELND